MILTDRALVESPRWHAGRLWFADWGPGEIVALDSADGAFEVVARAAAPPLSFDFLPDGRLIVVASRTPRLLRLEAGGELVTHAELSDLGVGWNEIVIDGRGNIYVNGGNVDPSSGNIDLVLPDGSARRVAEGAAFPNGMAIMPDNRTPNRCCVRVREGGRVLDRIDVDRGAFACMLAGAGRQTLYITAAQWFGMERMDEMGGTGQILSADVGSRGAGWPRAET